MEIRLRSGDCVKLDQVDYEYLVRHKWGVLRFNHTKYARISRRIDGETTSILMHRIIMWVMMGKTSIDGLRVDHIDGNGLNNQRSNLRLCTPSQNAANSKPRDGCTSKYKGVTWNKKEQKWFVHITINGKQKYLGASVFECEAAQIYNIAANRLFSEFARLNEIHNG